MTPITRRSVFTSVTAMAALAAIPARHAAALSIKSPIIRLNERSAVLHRPVAGPLPEDLSPFDIVSYYRQHPSLEFVPPVSIQAFHVTAEDGHRVSSVEEAEDQLLAALGDPIGFSYLPREPVTWCGDGTLPVMIAIHRGSNMISARTRIGTADTVLMSPMGLEVLLDHSSRYMPITLTFSLTEPQKIGRWRQVGKLWTGHGFFIGEDPVNPFANVFVGTHLPDDHVYVVRTAGDDHAVLIHENGRLYLVTDLAASFVRSVDFFYSLSVQPCL